MEKISRRDFLGLAGTAAVVTSALGFAASSNSAAHADELANEKDFDTTSSPIVVDESEITEELEADVVVIGCGIAGMSAARAATEAGASVVVIEKSATFNTRGGMGCQLGCINSKYTRDLYTLDGAYMTSRLMEQMCQYPSQQLLRYWADHSGETAEWFLSLIPEEKTEIFLTDTNDRTALKARMETVAEDELVIAVKSADYRDGATTETYPTGRYPEWGCNITVNFDPGTGFKLPLQTAQTYVESEGGTFLFGHSALYLEKEENRVTGAIAQKLEDGSYVRVVAHNGIVVATGDISGSKQMLDKYYGLHDYGEGRMGGYVDALGEATCNLGEGHQMCLWAGAAMEKAPFAPMAHGFDDFDLILDENGQRAINEDLGRQELSNWIVGRNKRPAYGINGNASGESACNTVEELAEVSGLDASVLQAAIDGYNELCASGVDTEYGKSAEKLVPLNAPYTIKECGCGSMLVMMGGIDCNTDCQALDEESNIIEGLYVAGNTMGRRFNVEYPMLVNGISNGSAIVFGRLAGTNAAAK